jgi:hypothetical protein
LNDPSASHTLAALGIRIGFSSERLILVIMIISLKRLLSNRVRT